MADFGKMVVLGKVVIFGVDGFHRRRVENGDFWVFGKKCVFG